MSESKNLVERRPAETASAVGGILGGALAVVLAQMFGFRDDAELTLAVGAIITVAVGFIGTVVTQIDLRRKKR